MHCTFHLTTSCPLRCEYCYAMPGDTGQMSEQTLLNAIHFTTNISNGDDTGIIFFGGEPLLKKELIYLAVNTCKEISKKTDQRFHFKITTNGLLLDEEFIAFAARSGVTIALSIDGIKQAHDQHRKTINGAPTFDLISPKIDLLLKTQPYASALMVVSPNTVQWYRDSVKYLFSRGFRYLICSLDFTYKWTQDNLEELKKQYHLLASLYKNMTLAEQKFYFSPFEVKLATHIMGKDAQCQKCALAQRQISIAPDGTIYPCVQFVQNGISNKEFSIGTVTSGFDEGKRKELFERSRCIPSQCSECAFNDRCNNSCSCLNWKTTGTLNNPSPVVCETEQILLPIVDKLGADLYKKRAPGFIQKHYNPAYPLLSLLEDLLYMT